MYKYIGVVVVVALGIYFAVASSNKDSAMMESDMKQETTSSNEMMDKKEDVMMKDENVMMKVGSYEQYSVEKIKKAETGKVVLFFRATWCPTCKVVDADIRANLKNIPEGVTILDVNYDNSSELKKKYGVTYQHTFVQVDKDGNMIKKWSGSPTLLSLVSEIK